MTEDDKSESAAPQQRPAHLWKPGQSGNPAGRRPGSRNKFAEQFVAAYQADFEVYGAAVLEKVRTDDPSTYLRVAATILPKEALLSLMPATSGLTEIMENWPKLRNIITAVERAGIAGDSEQAVDWLLDAANAHSAKLIEG